MHAFALVLLLALSACGSSLPTPDGQVFAFNPGKWEPTTADLTVPERVRK